MANSPKKVRPPIEVISSINKQAAEVRHAAAALTTRIQSYEDYLSKLSGRVETIHFGIHPDNENPEYPLELAIRFHREGKTWILSWANFNHEYHEDHAVDWAPLKDAPLRIKIAGVSMFPDLLGAIEKSQQQLVEEITQATQGYDEFAKTLAVAKESQQ